MKHNNITIAINGNSLCGKHTGLGVYVENVSKRLFFDFPESRIIVDGKFYLANDLLGFCNEPLGVLNRLINNYTFGKSARKLRADVVWMPTQIDVAFSYRARSSVLTIHDLTPLHFPQFHTKLAPWYKYVIPSILKKVSCVLTPSEATANDVRNYYKFDGEIVVTPLGFDKSRFYVRNASEVNNFMGTYLMRDYILYVGNIFPHKNLKNLLKAYAIASCKLPDLVICGKMDVRFFEDLVNLASSLGISKRVRFIDFISSGDLPMLYASARVLVFPSLYEGFGLPALEAMACGTPVILSNRGSLPEVGGGCGVYINPDDVEDISHALINVIEDDELRESLIECGLRRCQSFDWDITAKITSDLFIKTLYV
jgi:glycosyltransferase involved in cell wall biosynthesis